MRMGVGLCGVIVIERSTLDWERKSGIRSVQRERVPSLLFLILQTPTKEKK